MGWLLFLLQCIIAIGLLLHWYLLFLLGALIVFAAVIGVCGILAYAVHAELPKRLLIPVAALSLINGCLALYLFDASTIVGEEPQGFMFYYTCKIVIFSMGMAVIVTASTVRFSIIRLAVLPASLPTIVQNMIFEKAMRPPARQRLLNNALTDVRWTRVAIQTADGETLDGAIYLSTAGMDEGKESAENTKWCIWFLGNGGFFEMGMDLYANFAEQVGCGVLVFNYRGVGHSTGFPMRDTDLYADGQACVEHLIRGYNADPANILMFGHSLGGAIATNVRTLYPAGPLINDRSFSSLVDVPASWVMKAELPSNLSTYIIRVVKYYLHVLVSYRLDALSAWKKVQETGNAHMHVFYVKDDDIIDYDYASLYKALKKDVVKSVDSAVYTGTKLKRVPSGLQSEKEGGEEKDGNLLRLRSQYKPSRMRLHVPYSRALPSPHNARIDMLRHPKHNYKAHRRSESAPGNFTFGDAKLSPDERLEAAAADHHGVETVPKGLSPWHYITHLSRASLGISQPFVYKVDNHGFAVYEDMTVPRPLPHLAEDGEEDDEDIDYEEDDEVEESEPTSTELQRPLSSQSGVGEEEVGMRRRLNVKTNLVRFHKTTGEMMMSPNRKPYSKKENRADDLKEEVSKLEL